MVGDPLGDLLTRIRNAALAKHRELKVPSSKVLYAVARVFKDEGYLTGVKKTKNELLLTLAYKRRQPVLTHVKNISKPGLRIYKKAHEIPNPLGGAGISIVSTSKGIMTGRDARKKKLGGELLAEVW